MKEWDHCNCFCAFNTYFSQLLFLNFLFSKRDSVVTDSEGFNGFPQINIPFIFSRINHRPLVIMDGCSKCCEINRVSLTYGTLQVLPGNNDSIIEKMDNWKWCHHITDFLQDMHAWNQGCIKIMISPSFNSCSTKK